MSLKSADFKLNCSKFVQRPYCLDRPIKTHDEIKNVLENAEQKHEHGETISAWPSGRRPAEFRSASLQLAPRPLNSQLFRSAVRNSHFLFSRCNDSSFTP